MKIFGLTGYPLTHSFSKKYFNDQFEREGTADCRYELFPLSNINDFADLLHMNPMLKGLNVTIPHKINVLPFLNEIDEAAAAIGAVNCIAISSKNQQQWLKGYNTDAFGFSESLKPFLKARHQRALILGDGGAAKAVKYVLSQLGITFQTVVRTAAEGAITYDQLTAEIILNHQVIINTTPLGTFPDNNSAPAIPYELLTAAHLAYDLVYNPEETLFLQKAKARGAAIKNGLEMLHLQADRAWAIWNS
jgi:shikimate dehydrogenase